MTELDRLQREFSPDELFRFAVEAQLQDSDEYWDYFNALVGCSTREAFEVIRGYAYFAATDQRVLAAQLLGYFGMRMGRYHDECVALLIELLTDSDPEVVAQAARSLGVRGDNRSIDWLVDLRDHPDPGVRLGLAVSLGGCEDARAISALIELTGDPAEDVRDWATFGLGQLLEADTSEIREALAARLSDESLEVRGEAMVGLALRGDDRVYPFIRTELLGEFRGVHPLQAAEILGAADLAPLIAAQRSWLSEEMAEVFGVYFDHALASLRQALLYERGLRLRIQEGLN